MLKVSAAAVVVLLMAAGTANSQTEREPPSLGKKYVGCVQGSAATGYTFSVAPDAGSSTTRPRRYGLVAGKGLAIDLSTLVNKRVGITATLAEEKRTVSASASSGGSSSSRQSTASREVLTANLAQVVPGSCTP
jgi:hypothetical protein